MNFDESIKYLFNLGNEVLAMKLGLGNIGKLLDALGNPQENYLKVQVAGTNGKGSTCAFLEAICVSAEINVGMTTSPHLVSITERVKINGKEISEADFARYATRIRETSEQLVENFKAKDEEKSAIRNPQSGISLETVPTFFEQVTAIALLAFSEAKVKLAILETGLGGRFDAVTAARAEIVAITPVDYDHQRILGETLTLIAAEKAAIIRRNTKVIIAPQKDDAERVILDRCREVGVQPIRVSSDFQLKTHRPELNQPRIAINFSTENDSYHDIVLGLAGKHQIINALVAVTIAETLRDFDFQIEKEHIWKGLENARHEGRLEFYGNFLFDGAHNASGAKALRDFLDEFVEQPIVMIFGAMRDKDLAEIAEILFPKAREIILTTPDNPRSMKATDLSKLLPENIERGKIIIAENVESAIKAAKSSANDDSLICVTGSLYLIGQVKKILAEN
ncbi:MAG: folylpolyglutamate synthase/dihydrofolate synthase family protein [Actinomycetota bacterium]